MPGKMLGIAAVIAIGLAGAAWAQGERGDTPPSASGVPAPAIEAGHAAEAESLRPSADGDHEREQATSDDRNEHSGRGQEREDDDKED